MPNGIPTVIWYSTLSIMSYYKNAKTYPCDTTKINGLVDFQKSKHVSLLGHVSKIVSILLSKLSDSPNTDTSS